MIRCKRSLISLALLTLLAGRLSAADGRIPISQAQIPSLITVPGHYYLTEDVSSAVAGQIAIQIATGEVDLDLNGHTITMSGTGSTYGVFAGGFSTNAYGITIRDGRIRGAFNDVRLFTPANGWLSNVRLERLSLVAGASTALATARSGTGLFSNLVIERCQFFANNQSHISIDYAQGLRIAGSEIRAVNSTTNPDIFIQNSASVVVADNVITGGGIGLELASVSGARVAGNSVTGAANAGIHIVNSYGNEISHNASTSNGTGILLTGAGSTNYNTVEGNLMSGNSVAGLSIVAPNVGNAYGRNRALFNGPGGAANYSIAANNRTAGDNCDTTVCTN